MRAQLSDSRIDRILLTAEDIADAVARLGADITEDYQGRDLVLITVLKGGLVFLADL